MPRIAILAQMRAQPGKRQALMDALAPLHDAVKAEPGTEVFIMHASDADPVTHLRFRLPAALAPGAGGSVGYRASIR